MSDTDHTVVPKRKFGEVSALLGNIPAGKTRVVSVDKFSDEEYPHDFDTPEEAFKYADDCNKERQSSLDGVCYVYNDRGDYIRGPEAVSKIG